MRKYYVDYMFNSCKRHKQFFNTLQEAISTLEKAKRIAELNNYLGMFGYGTVIDVPKSDQNITDDELIKHVNTPKYINIKCDEHKVLSRYAF